MPQIVIDLSWVSGFMQQSPLQIAWDFFRYVGWIPFVVILWDGFSKVWIMSRQGKYAATLTYTLLSIQIQRSNEQSPKAVEHLFTHLAGTYSSPNWKEKWVIGKFTPAFSFELVSIDGYTQFVVRTPTAMRDLIEAAVFSQHPDAEIQEIADYTLAVPLKYPDPEWDAWGTEFILAKPSAYPIRTYSEFEHVLSQEFKDPLSSLLESMSRLKRGEQVWLQLLVYPRDQTWKDDAAKIVGKIIGRVPKVKISSWAKPIHATTAVGEAIVGELMRGVFGGEPADPKEKKKEENKMNQLSPGEKKTLEAMEVKMAKLGFGVKFRFCYVGKRSAYRKGPVISMIRGALGLFGSLDANGFKAYGPVTPKTDYFWQRWSAEEKKNKIMRAFSQRSGAGSPPFVLNVEELASLWHFPQITVKAPLIKKVESKKVEPPFTLPTM